MDRTRPTDPRREDGPEDDTEPETGQLRAGANWGAIAAEYLHGEAPATTLGQAEAEFLAQRGRPAGASVGSADRQRSVIDWMAGPCAGWAAGTRERSSFW